MHGGVSVQGGLCPRGSLSGRSLFRRSLSGGSLCRGVSVQGVSVYGSLCKGVSVQGGLCPEVSVQGGLCTGVSVQVGLCQGDLPRQRPPPPVDRMTDVSKNITFPQTSFAGSNNRFATHPPPPLELPPLPRNPGSVTAVVTLPGSASAGLSASLDLIRQAVEPWSLLSDPLKSMPVIALLLTKIGSGNADHTVVTCDCKASNSNTAGELYHSCFPQFSVVPTKQLCTL